MTVRDMVKVYKMMSSNQPSVVGNVFRLAAKKPALVVLVVCIASLYTAAVTGNPYIPPIEYAKFWHGNASVNADLVPISFEVDDSATISAPLVTNIELVSSEKSKFNYLFPLPLGMWSTVFNIVFFD